MIEYYTSSLGPDLAMFSKMQVKPTLSETYEEVKRVEVEKESIEDYPDQSGEKKFEKIFRNKYASQKTHAALMKGLCTLKKERKEKVHSFT